MSQDPNYTGAVGKEKRLHQNVFGPLNLDSPKCKKLNCNRRAWFSDYCPKHNPPKKDA